MSKRILAAACAAATALALSACTSTASSGDSSSKDGSLTVMASFYPLKYLAEKIGGEHVTVTSLTPDGAEPHDLELSPKMVDSLSSADAVVYLAGFQGAVDEAIEQLRHAERRRAMRRENSADSDIHDGALSGAVPSTASSEYPDFGSPEAVDQILRSMTQEKEQS